MSYWQHQRRNVQSVSDHTSNTSDETYSLCHILRFRRGLSKFFRLPRYYAAWGGLKPTLRGYLPVPSSISWPLKMAPIGSPETSVSNRLALRNDPEDGRTRSGWVFQICRISLHRRTASWRHWMTRLRGNDDKRGYSIGKAGHAAWVEKSFLILDRLHVLEAGQDGKYTHFVL